MTISPERFAELDALSTEELRDQAFHLAEHKHDVGFFWELVKHLPESAALATEDGSMGDITGSLVETVQAARELFFRGHIDEAGPAEPLLRAKFIDYLGTDAADAADAADG